MPHIHQLIDFTVSAFIVHHQKILLVNHNQLKLWLPIGGHIELHEDSDQALFREIKEETGLNSTDLTLLTDPKPDLLSDRRIFLYRPNFMDIHRISATHRHIGLIYFLTSSTDQVTLAAAEHTAIKWFSLKELTSTQNHILPDIQYYCRKAIQQSAGFIS